MNVGWHPDLSRAHTSFILQIEGSGQSPWGGGGVVNMVWRVKSTRKGPIPWADTSRLIEALKGHNTQLGGHMGPYFSK